MGLSMTTIYLVRHLDKEADDDDDMEKIIGVYSTEERALKTLERLRDKPGFRENPDHWQIERITLDKDSFWADGFSSIAPGERYWEDKS